MDVDVSAVRAAAKYCQTRLGAVSEDPDGTVAARNQKFGVKGEDPCAVHVGEVPKRGAEAAAWRAHLEANAQRHRCKSAPSNPVGEPTGSGGPKGKSQCLLLDSAGKLKCRLHAPWPL